MKSHLTIGWSFVIVAIITVAQGGHQSASAGRYVQDGESSTTTANAAPNPDSELRHADQVATNTQQLFRQEESPDSSCPSCNCYSGCRWRDTGGRQSMSCWGCKMIGDNKVCQMWKVTGKIMERRCNSNGCSCGSFTTGYSLKCP